MEKSLARFRAQGLNVVHQVPDLVRLEGMGERRHRRSIQPGREIFEHVAARLTAFKVVSAGQVERENRISFVIGERQGGRTISPAFLAVTTPAIQTLKKFRSAMHALGGCGRLWRYDYRRDGWFFLKSRRKTFDVRDQAGALLTSQGLPRWHGAVVKAAADGVEQVAVGGKAAAWRGTAFESSLGKIARLGIEVRSIFSGAVAMHAVARDAVAPVQGFSTFCVASQVADFAL